MRRAAIVLTVAAVLPPFAALWTAEGAGWPLALPPAGYCVPAPEDPAFVPRTVRALGSPGVATAPIAILDTGVDPSAPQLDGRVLPGYEAPGGGPAGGDADGHGTQAAGLAAADGAGVLGISPASPILPVRIFNDARASTADSLAKGIDLAVAHGAGVISISGSGPLADASAGDVAKVTRAIGTAFSKGVLVVGGAGDDTNAAATMPGGLPHVLTAGSATPAGSRAPTSGAGPWLDVLVPADGVTSPLPLALCNHGFGFASGTSFAAPTLAAAAALVKAKRPALTGQQSFELIRRAATDIAPAGRDNDTGFGMLDVSAALSAAPPAKESSPEVDDDPFWVRGPYAAAHPRLLTKKKMRFKVTGSVSAAKDPADLYPIQLTRRERVVVTVNAADPGALLELSILGPKAGDFDIANAVDKNRLVSTGGLSKDPQLELTASRSGTYYIAIEAADPVDPDDPTATASDLDPYQLSAYKQRKKAKKTKR